MHLSQRSRALQDHQHGWSVARGGGSIRALRPPETHYVIADGAHLAYQVFGAGDIDVLLLSPAWGHLDLRWEWPGYAQLMSALGSFARVVMFDKRGTGLSDRAVVGDIEQQARDAIAVMDASDTRRAFAFGLCDGGAVAAQLSLIAPERLLGLVAYALPVFGERRGELGVNADWDRMLTLAGAGWDAATLLPVMSPSVAQDAAFRAWWRRYTRASVSPDGFATLAEVWRRLDLSDVLSQVVVRTLVIHRTGDHFVPVENGREAARLIPGSAYVELPGDDYFAWVGDVEAIVATVRRFCLGTSARPTTPTIVAALAVASSGDVSWAPGGELHERLVEYAGSRGGRSVLTPDGPAAVFPTLGPALEAAERLLQDAEGHSAKVGVHLGEAAVSGDLRSSPAVRAARELAMAAAPGSLLVSRPVGDLAESCAFRSRGVVRVGGRDTPVLESTVPRPGSRPVETLTAREREVWEMLGEGLANKQIARRLGISDKTVKNHVTALLAKLGVTDRTSAALLAARRGG